MMPVQQVQHAGSLVRRGLARLKDRRGAIGSIDVDVLDTPETFVLHADAPGVTEDDVQVRYVEGDVYLRIERFRPAYEGYDLVVDGRVMSFDGRISLPEDASVDPDLAEATLNGDGTLHITIPKVEHVPDPSTATVND